MGFPKRLLNDYETVVEDLHPHWLFLFGPAVSALLSLVLVVVASAAGTTGTVHKVTQYGAIALFVVAALAFLWRYMEWKTTNFVITTDRLIFRHGVVGKSGIEIPLERVNNVSMRQGVLERILGAGSLLIESGGEDGQQRFSHVRHPERVQNMIHAQIEANDMRKAGASRGGGTTDVATQLEKLEQLMLRGTLTPEEFQAQKAKLLGA